MICKVSGEAHGDSTDALGSCPPYDAVIILQSIEQELNDEFKLFDLLVAELFFAADLLFFLVFHLLVSRLLADSVGRVRYDLRSDA